MTFEKKPLAVLVSSTLIVSVLALAGCNKNTPDATTAAPTAPPATTPAAYTPPSADQLQQMVAPIALFPDKLVAQVLAASTFPDQVTAANQWLGQNPTLKGAALQTAANQQPWDVSVRSLTAFPDTLAQMAQNIAWTTSLGEAYVNDPTDVMNAIQVMRQRAQQQGNLKSSAQLKVAVTDRAPPLNYSPDANAPPVYAGPAIIPPPAQTIVIEPAQPNTVYVPSYNPAVVYGSNVPYYPGYSYAPPPVYRSNAAEVGLLSFGAGILVGAVLSGSGGGGGGWHSWGMNWGGGGGGPDRGNAAPGWHRPAVVYNNQTYISKSTTVINRVSNTRITNNYTNNSNNTNYGNNNGAPGNAGRPSEARPGGGQPSGPQGMPRNEPAHGGPGIPATAQGGAQHPGPSAQPNAPMTMPHFNARDARPGAPAAAAMPNGPTMHAQPGHEAGRPGAATPAPMTTPHFGAVPGTNSAQHAQAARPESPTPMRTAPEHQMQMPAGDARSHTPNVQAPAAVHEPSAARPNTPAPHVQRDVPTPQAQPHPQASPPQAQHPQPQPRPQAEPRPQAQPHPQAEPRPQAQPHPQAAPHPQPQPHPQAAPHPQAQRSHGEHEERR